MSTNKRKESRETPGQKYRTAGTEEHEKEQWEGEERKRRRKDGRNKERGKKRRKETN